LQTDKLPNFSAQDRVSETFFRVYAQIAARFWRNDFAYPWEFSAKYKV
jgi:hypothetical protein